MAGNKNNFLELRALDQILGSSASIASSTNATPIVITTSAAHGYAVNDTVTVQGHLTNTNANGVWILSAVTATTMTLTNAVGNGVGGATGTTRYFYDPGATLYVGLWTTSLVNLSTGSTGTEVSGGSYARVAVPNNLQNWADATVVSLIGQKQNALALTFPTATGSWGTVTDFAILDAASTGNMLYHATLTTSKTISNGDTASFAINALTVTET